MRRRGPVARGRGRWPSGPRLPRVDGYGLATGKSPSSARCGGRLRVTTLSCSLGSVRATTATVVTSLRFTGRCGVPGGTYREIGGRHDHAMPQALAVPHLGLAADGVNGGLVHVVDMGRRAG